MNAFDWNTSSVRMLSVIESRSMRTGHLRLVGACTIAIATHGCATAADDGTTLPADVGLRVDSTHLDAPADAAEPDTAREDGTTDASLGDTGHADSVVSDAPLGDASGGGDAPDTANPCFGVSCNTPPLTVCADATNLRVYASAGTCDLGACQYASSLIACALGCASGKCKGDPCVGVTCNTPPSGYCSDATHLTAYVAAGASCSGGTCSYTTQVQYCSFGCSGNVCNGDPCAGKTCSTPPAAFCSDANNLTVYDSPGTCSGAGNCGYASHSQYCTYGCSGGKCLMDPCAGLTCNTPAAAYCSGANTLKTFGAAGTCTAGTCNYPSTEKSCTGGCVSGVCKDCSASAPCSSGNWCSAAGSCTACNTDQHCGASCADCSATGGVCNGTACVQCVTDGQCGGGKWCNAGSCASCNTATHCGATCAACGGTSPVCNGTSCTCDATSCGSGASCTGGSCVTCNTTSMCGPTCSACGASTPTCAGTAAGCKCTTSPDSCGGTSSFCNAAGACAACGAGACGNGRCDCGETAASCAADCGPACPTALSLATFAASTDGWTTEGSWRRDASGGGVLVHGSSVSYSSSYTQNATNGANVDLSGCGTTAVKLGFSVRLSDDPNYASKTTDKTERLYVQCSGDGGTTWTNLTPGTPSWPANQSPCATSYCSGNYGLDRSFPWTAQSLTLPATCVSKTTRIRFSATGKSQWNLMNPGWWVDTVTIN